MENDISLNKDEIDAFLLFGFEKLLVRNKENKNLSWDFFVF